jgi:hypothetical protein
MALQGLVNFIFFLPALHWHLMSGKKIILCLKLCALQRAPMYKGVTQQCLIAALG